MKRILPLLVLFFLGAANANAERRLVGVESCKGYDKSLTVSFLNVGQGDAVLIQCPDGATQALLDAGDSDDRYPSGHVLFRRAFLQRMDKDRHLELAVNTHPHQDHLFGFLKILEEGRIGITRYIDNGADDAASPYEEGIRRLSAQRGTVYQTLRSSERIALCPGERRAERAELLLFPPPPAWTRQLGCPDALNDCSIVSRLDYQGVSFLFLADALYRWESLALSSPEGRSLIKGVDVLKIGHHGSGSTSKELLSISAPAAVVLSTGEAGKGTTVIHRFPERSVIQRLISYFRTFGPIVSDRKMKDDGDEKTRERRTLSTCGTSGACRWDALEIPENIWSTATAGTIDVRVKNNRACLEGELLTEKLELRF